MTTHTARPRALRVAMVVGGSVISERTVESREPVRFELPDLGPLTLMEPTSDGGWNVLLDSRMRGAIWNAKGRCSVSQMAGESLKVGPADYGVLTIGQTALFFQRVDFTPGLRRFIGFDPNAIASLSMSTFLHAAALLLLFLAQRESPHSAELELPADLVRRFLAIPTADSADTRTSDTDDLLSDHGDPAARDELVASAESPGSEGAAGGGEPAARTTRPRPAPSRPAAPIGSLLAAIQGDEGEDHALSAATGGPDIASLLSELRVGRPGPGTGSGLRSGGGDIGTGSGERQGPGEANTQVGDDEGRDERTNASRGGRAEADLDLGAPPPTEGPGWLPPEAITRVVRRNQRAIRYCYELSLQRRPALRGRVDVTWRIGPDGSVRSARVRRTTLRDQRAEGCMLRQVGRWRFQPPEGGDVIVHFPFLFQSGS